MEKKKRKLHPLVIVLMVVLSLMLLLCATVAGLWIHGQNTVNREMAAPSLPVPSPSAAPEGAETEPAEPQPTPEEPREEGVVSYNGKLYKYNDNMRNILLMGIDSDNDSEGHVQADVLVLVALDLGSDKMTLINVSRDTVCDFAAGEGFITAQLALSYAYGDGGMSSVENTRDAVSNIFYGLPIQGCGAFFLNGIAPLNDAVGGVPVTVIGDYPFYIIPGGWRLWEGNEIVLTGDEADIYIRCRSENRVDANELRMVRQKQYMLALISQARTRILDNPASVLSMYDAVDEYILTDLSLSEISYLASKAAVMDFAGELRSVTGELSLNEKNEAELRLDESALFELMLDVFYTEIQS